MNTPTSLPRRTTTLTKFELALLMIAPIFGLVGTLGAVLGSMMENPPAAVSGFGTAGEWFAGTAAVSAICVALLHRAHDDDSATTSSIAILVGHTYSYQSLVANFSSGSGSYGPMHAALSRTQGDIAAEVERLGWSEQLSESIDRLRPEGTTAALWNAPANQILINAATELRTRARSLGRSQQ